MTEVGLFFVSLFGGGGLLVMLLRRTFSDRDTRQAGYEQGRTDTEDRYRRAIDALIKVNAELVTMAAPENRTAAALLANRALAALHKNPNPDPPEGDIP